MKTTKATMLDSHVAEPCAVIFFLSADYFVSHNSPLDDVIKCPPGTGKAILFVISLYVLLSSRVERGEHRLIESPALAAFKRYNPINFFFAFRALPLSFDI